MRLNKFLATAGVDSRRKCDEIIVSGRVRVNAKVVKKLATQVDPERDIVSLDNKPIRLKNDFVYYMLNKPTGVVTTVKDQFGRPTVMSFFKNIKKRVYPVGRLDYNSSGLLLLTNDGDTAQRLLHPSFDMDKVYMVTIRQKLSNEQVSLLCKGVNIGDFVTSPAKVDFVKNTKDSFVYQVTIHEGKNRQVRRMFDAVGSRVYGLKRVAMGELLLGDLPEGKYRELTQKEVKYILSLGEKS